MVSDRVRPLAGISVVELAAGTSDLGLGLAGGLPGMMLGDLGADVTRIVGTTAPGIDETLGWGRAWHRDKRIVALDDAAEIRSLISGADVALVYGPERLVERRGLGWADVARPDGSLVYARCRPSRVGSGAIDDYALLVEARTGFCSQLAGHRDGPIFVDVHAPGSGAAFILTVSVLGLLYRRARHGVGGWAETSLYDGMLATLGCMIGRSERASPDVEGYWERGSTFPNFLYRCGDGELIQVWFGGKGMYQRLIDVLGDEPSANGYYQDQATGALRDRAERWRPIFATRPRDAWIAALRDAGVAAEPVFGPGEVLRDPHVTETGLARSRSVGGRDEVTVATPIDIAPLTPRGEPPPRTAPASAAPASDTSPRGGGAPGTSGDLLAGLRVVDFSAFVAGPLAGEILADLGADVIKVEPPQGEAMRGAAYAIAACQRGKRSLAIDINAPEARPVVESLLRSADVVMHNFRVGVSERLGIDEASVARLNPAAVYLHASAFGTTGPRAAMPGNDALMQAVTGFERAIGGAGNDPIAATWIPIDMTGGWIGAAATLAALYARAVSGCGHRVATSLLGAGMLLHSGAVLRDGQLDRGPSLDAGQTGYGPGYRIYRAGDGGWFALVVPDATAWAALRGLAGEGVPATFSPIRNGDGSEGDAQRAEAVLESLFADGTADGWVARLRAGGLLAERVAELSRDEFRRGILDDPVNRQLSRVAVYETDDWGHFEQIGPLVRYGPADARGPALMLPGVGEHSAEVLADLGCDATAPSLIDAGVLTAPARTPSDQPNRR